jgi:hypothetical protein
MRQHILGKRSCGRESRCALGKHVIMLLLDLDQIVPAIHTRAVVYGIE